MRRTGLLRGSELQRGTQLQRRAPLRAKAELRRGRLLRSAPTLVPGLESPYVSAAQLRRELTIECCGKRRFATQEVAETEVARLSLSVHDRLPGSTYQCDEGWWHLTHQTAAEQAARGAVIARRRSADHSSGIPAAVCRLVDKRDSVDGVRLCIHCGSPNRLHRHHRRFRSHPGPHMHCACNVITVCDDCHTWAHRFGRALAEAAGLILRAEVQTPWLQPVLVRRDADSEGTRLWPTCDGEWQDYEPEAVAA